MAWDFETKKIVSQQCSLIFHFCTHRFSRSIDEYHGALHCDYKLWHASFAYCIAAQLVVFFVCIWSCIRAYWFLFIHFHLLHLFNRVDHQFHIDYYFRSSFDWQPQNWAKSHNFLRWIYHTRSIEKLYFRQCAIETIGTVEWGPIGNANLQNLKSFLSSDSAENSDEPVNLKQWQKLLISKIFCKKTCIVSVQIPKL